MNNLQSIFDAITGFDGASVTDDWRTMGRSELLVSIHSEAGNKPVSSAEADAIADAVVALRECIDCDTAFTVRDGLERFTDRLLALKLTVHGRSISVPSSLTSGERDQMCREFLLARMHVDGDLIVYEATEYAADLIFGRL